MGWLSPRDAPFMGAKWLYQLLVSHRNAIRLGTVHLKARKLLSQEPLASLSQALFLGQCCAPPLARGPEPVTGPENRAAFRRASPRCGLRHKGLLLRLVDPQIKPGLR